MKTRRMGSDAKDSTLVRAAEAVRDGVASAMVSAGNTGATMASGLLRMGRIRGVGRPAIAAMIPCTRRHSDGAPRCWRELRSSSRLARAVCSDGQHLRRTSTRNCESAVGLLSIGEEAGKGDSLRKRHLDC